MTYSRPGVYLTERLLPGPVVSTGTADAAGAVIGQFAQGPTSVTLVTSWYDFVRKFGGYSASYPATFGVAQYFQNGGSELYVKRVLTLGAETGNATFAAAEIADTTSGATTPVTKVTAIDPGTDGNKLRVQLTSLGFTDVDEEVRSPYYTLTVYKEGALNNAATTAGDIILEQYPNVVFNDVDSPDYIQTVVNASSSYIELSETKTTGTPSTALIALEDAVNGSAPTTTMYSGAIQEFASISRPLVFFSPGLPSLSGITEATVYAAWASWAASHNGFIIAETTGGTSSANAISEAAAIGAHTNVAVYFPHLYIADPLGRSPQALRKIGPSGSMAGLYMNTDKRFGPFKAPAGLQSLVRGAVALETSLTSDDLEALNGGVFPVNAIRNIPGAGIVSMGARTLLQDGTANKYVNMRRSLIYLRSSLELLTQFALFENNDERLWARIRSTIGVFLNDYRNAGGLRGVTENQAYFVKCDAENNPDSAIQNGEVHIEVGVALQYPAEFVVINLSQKTAV